MSTNNNANANAVAQTFTNGLFGSVRVLMRNGEPWFVATDIAKALQYTNAPAMTRHVDSDDKDMTTSHTPGGPQQLSLINEAGLYSAILRSRKPEAKQFKKWVVAEVLPSIRKTGGYIQAGPEDTPETIMAKAVLVADKTIKELQGKVTEMQPKADFVDNFVEAKGCLSLRATANELGVRPNKFNERLREDKIVYSSKGFRNMPYQPYLKLGYFVVKPVIANDSTMRTTTKVTSLGYKWLASRYGHLKGRL